MLLLGKNQPWTGNSKSTLSDTWLLIFSSIPNVTFRLWDLGGMTANIVSRDGVFLRYAWNHVHHGVEKTRDGERKPGA